MEAAGEDSSKENKTNVLPPNINNTPGGAVVLPAASQDSRKSKREERFRVDKNVEQFMKSLNSIPTMEEKFSVISKKFVQMSDENRKLHFFIKQTDKRYALIEKEKDQLQLEYNKVVLVKSKLENLCRELQKQNKAIKEESLLKIREEDERRKESQAKFQNTLSEITTLLQQNNEKNTKLRDDNISLTERFKSVFQQYQLREQQVDKMSKQMSLESQLSDAKVKKAALEHQAEKERIQAEMEQLKVTLAQYRAKIVELQGTETALKSQLTVYTDKYDEFQNALTKSNEVFGGFKEQMEKMSKKIQKLEKESLMWKKRWETSQTALLDMCGERQASEERCGATTKHLNQMQSLCRTLQAERTLLLNTLKENNIERPSVPVQPPAPPPGPQPSKPASNAKVDAIPQNSAQLRQSIEHIQSQIATLTNIKDTAQEAAAKKEKSKKSKSKKIRAEKLAQKQAAEKAETKEQESDDSNTKSNSEELQPSTSEVNIESERNSSLDDKIDSKTMTSLIQAINMANINLCDLEVVNNEENDDNVSKDAVVNKINDDVVLVNDAGENQSAKIQTNITETDLKENKTQCEINLDEVPALNETSQNNKMEINEVAVKIALNETPQVNKKELSDAPVETALNETPQVNKTELNDAPVETALNETPQVNKKDLSDAPVGTALNETSKVNKTELNDAPVETALNETQVNKKELNDAPVETALNETQVNKKELNDAPVETALNETPQVNKKELNDAPVETALNETPQVNKIELNGTPVETALNETRQVNKVKSNEAPVDTALNESPPGNEKKLDKVLTENVLNDTPQVNEANLNNVSTETVLHKNLQANDTKLNEVLIVTGSNETPQRNGDDKAKDKETEPVTNESIDNLPVDSKIRAESKVLSPKKEKEAKEAVVLQGN